LKRLKNIWYIIKLVFIFRKPRFIEIHHIDLIIEDRPFFLITWHLKNVLKLKILPLKKNYWENACSVIIKLPENTNIVYVKASNIWRSSKLKIILKHTRLNEATSQLLIQKPSQPDPVLIKKVTVLIQNMRANPIPSSITLKRTYIRIKNIFHLIKTKFNYL
jgi:hypothetical protein